MAQIQDGTVDLIEAIRQDAVHVRDNESAVILQLKVLLFDDRLRRLLESAPISRPHFEYHLKGVGYIDLLLFHVDGGATIIEAKGPGSSRELCHGIGQLFLYEAALRRLTDDRPLSYVNKVLCAPAYDSQDSGPTSAACALAGVGFLKLASFRYLRTVWNSEMGG